MKIFAGEQVSRYTDAQMFLCTDGHLHRFAVCPPVLVQLSHHGMFGLDNVTVTFIDIVQKRFHHVRHIMHLHLSIVGQDICVMGYLVQVVPQPVNVCWCQIDLLVGLFSPLSSYQILLKNASCEPSFSIRLQRQVDLGGTSGPSRYNLRHLSPQVE
jgi:hypothetical protein